MYQQTLKKLQLLQKKYKIEVPFMRPKNLSQNLSDDKSYVFHFLSFIKRRNSTRIHITNEATTPFKKFNSLKSNTND